MTEKLEPMRFTQNCVHNRYKYSKGQVAQFPQKEISVLIDRRVAERVTEEKGKKQ